MKYPIRVATVSDIHLGAKRNETSFILENLKKAFPDNQETAQIDLLVLVGDVFDGLLSLPDDFIAQIDFWILSLLRLCKKHDIVLRVLEGTPSHDWKQSERFVTLNIGAQIHCDLRYVQQLEIEYIERFDAQILYIPDEWDENPQKTLNEVKELMTLKNLDKVDFAFMHGQFEYQLPAIVKAPKHDSQSYLKIVRHLIFIGHVHLFSRLDRILAQGSFDRLAHGEEGPKGHIRATVFSESEYEVTFIENKSARKFITIELGNEDLPTSFDLIESRIIEDDIPPESFIRISSITGHPLLSSMDHLIRQWPLMTWSKIVRDTEKETNSNLTEAALADDTFTPITITKDNIEGLILQRVKIKTQDPEILDLISRAMKDLK